MWVERGRHAATWAYMPAMLGWALRIVRVLPWVALLVVMAYACATAHQRAVAAGSSAAPERLWVKLPR